MGAARHGERPAPTPNVDQPLIRLQLRRADPSVSARVAAAINKRFAQAVAKPVHPGLVAVTVPEPFAGRGVEFLGIVQDLAVESDSEARIVINERTGTIVMGKSLPIAPVSILHGALTVEIRTQYDVSQPAPLSAGQTTITPDTKVNAKEERARNVTLNQGATVEELVRGLQAIGATPRDVIAILDGLRSAGALNAEIEVI